MHSILTLTELLKDLKDQGVVVLVTARTHAIQITAQASGRLGINVDDEEGAFLQHISFEMDDRGWEDCLMYSESADYQPDELHKITIHAIRDWIAGGEKDYHLCQMRKAIV